MTRFCEQCGESFDPKRDRQRFCRGECRMAWHLGERHRALALLRGAPTADSSSTGTTTHSTLS
jgi:hypothetical protein